MSSWSLTIADESALSCLSGAHSWSGVEAQSNRTREVKAKGKRLRSNFK